MFSSKALVVIAASLASLPQVHAWGALGHEIVASIAQEFITSTTRTYVKTILGAGPTNTTYMADVSKWADAYRSMPGGGWSGPLHYIDALDSPPTTCHVDLTRDCGEFCVVGAIANYTTIIRSPDSLDAEKLDALRFIIHFIGDIHQPLHADSLDGKGGNSIKVKFGNSTTNLHSLWDTALVQTLVGGSNQTAGQEYAATLTKAIRNGRFGWSPSSWIRGLDVSDPFTTVMTWASQSNKYMCTDVVPDGVAAVTDMDLSGDYYKSHNHVVRIQLARAGYRLAAWLNAIAATRRRGHGQGF